MFHKKIVSAMFLVLSIVIHSSVTVVVIKMLLEKSAIDAKEIIMALIQDWDVVHVIVDQHHLVLNVMIILVNVAVSQEFMVENVIGVFLGIGIIRNQDVFVSICF